MIFYCCQFESNEKNPTDDSAIQKNIEKLINEQTFILKGSAWKGFLILLQTEKDKTFSSIQLEFMSTFFQFVPNFFQLKPF